MADSKITALTAISTVDPAADPLVIVDVSDTSMAASGTTKKGTINQLLGAGGTATLASATITGDLTVDTSTLKVDSANNRVGIGTATPGAGYSLDILGAAVGGIRVSSNNYPNLVVDSANSNGALIYIQEGGTTQARIGHLTAVTGLEFSGNNGTAATNVHYAIDSTGISTWKNVGGVAGTAMTLNSTGLLVGTTSMPSGVTFARLVAKSTSGDWSGVIWNSNATPYGFRIQHDTDSNGTGNEFLYCLGGANLRASIRSNGGIANYQANDVSLSDSRLKTDIKPLASYWNKIKSLELVTFKYKDQTHSDDNIGLIAQQVESVAPELVDVDGFGETPDDGVPLKTIYTTDLYHAAIKALQEAMTRIEALEAKLA